MLVDVGPDGTFDCVICDFGFANFIGDKRTLTSGLKVPSTTGISIRYAAPELLERKHGNFRLNAEIDKKIDVYAFGIMLYEIVGRCVSWNNLAARVIMNKVVEGKRPAFKTENEDVNARFEMFPGLNEIAAKCWSANPADRPGFDEIYDGISAIAILQAYEPLTRTQSRTLVSQMDTRK